jgi:hypothetical protein
MKIVFMLFLLLALAFGLNTGPKLTFLQSDDDETLLCGDGCYKHMLNNGVCDDECSHSSCAFVDVEDCFEEQESES